MPIIAYLILQITLGYAEKCPPKNVHIPVTGACEWQGGDKVVNHLTLRWGRLFWIVWVDPM